MTLPRAYLITASSFVWLIGGFVLMEVLIEKHPGPLNNAQTLGIQLTLGGFAIIFLVGMGVWAAAKGWHPIIGVLLGLFCSAVGLIILLLLPDKSKHTDNADHSA